MNKNPFKPGTDEYLDWATEQHTKATSPKKKTKTKTTAKKKDKISEAKKEAEERQKRYTGGLAGMLGLR